MVDSIKPTHPALRSGSSTRQNQRAPSVEPHNDEKQDRVYLPKKPPVERRRKRDRRKGRSSAPRAIYELRSGKDRRKNDKNHPSIEIEI